MLIKTITYENYFGETLTEDFHFNLNKAEVIKLQTSKHGGYDEVLKRMVAANDIPAMMKELDKIVLASYGVRSDDGKRFIKDEQLTKDFMDSEAYVELYTELLYTDTAEPIIAFINGVFPKNVEKLSKNLAS